MSIVKGSIVPLSQPCVSILRGTLVTYFRCTVWSMANEEVCHVTDGMHMGRDEEPRDFLHLLRR